MRARDVGEVRGILGGRGQGKNDGGQGGGKVDDKTSHLQYEIQLCWVLGLREVNSDIWGVFHDGAISRIWGSIHKTVNLEIDISYLRNMFSEPGDSFLITLVNCSLFKYTEFGSLPTFDLQEIAQLSPEILYVTNEDPLVISCVNGTMELIYESILIALSPGINVSYEDLTDANTRYWNRIRT
ncbi:hypothetical protein [Fluviicoccus keumensis]|nr:hypothetical protein [Fluviicoccus keumensis]